VQLRRALMMFRRNGDVTRVKASNGSAEICRRSASSEWKSRVAGRRARNFLDEVRVRLQHAASAGH
jgi:hypothetical protein